MGLRDKLLTCPELEEGGVWFDVLDTGSSFLCRRFPGEKLTLHTAYQKMLEPFFVEGKDGEEGRYDLSSDEAEEAILSFWAENVILDWQNVTSYDVYGEGHPEEPEPYSPEACIKLMKDIPGVFTAVGQHAGRRENYLLALRKKQMGN